MPWPCPRRSVVKPSGQGGQNKRPLEGRVKAPTRTNGPPNSARDRGPSNPKWGRQGHRHAMSIAGCYTGRCRDYNPCSRQSPGSARRGRYVNPASSSANVQGRKAQTDVPVREKLRSQPGREDHQAYRYSKGSEATESEEDRANATRCLSQEAIGTAVETTSQVVDRV